MMYSISHCFELIILILLIWTQIINYNDNYNKQMFSSGTEETWIDRNKKKIYIFAIWRQTDVLWVWTWEWRNDGLPIKKMLSRFLLGTPFCGKTQYFCKRHHQLWHLFVHTRYFCPYWESFPEEPAREDPVSVNDISQPPNHFAVFTGQIYVFNNRSLWPVCTEIYMYFKKTGKSSLMASRCQRWFGWNRTFLQP